MEKWRWHGLGSELQQVETLLYYDGPIIFVMEDTRDHKKYLAQNIESKDYTELYLLFAVTDERLAMIKRGDISLLRATLECEEERVWQVTVDNDGLMVMTLRRRPQSLAAEELPTEDVRLDVQDADAPRKE